MRATRGHILQEVVMHVIDVILIGRWFFAGWRVARMWSEVLDAGFRLRRDIYHVTLGLHLRQQPLLLRTVHRTVANVMRLLRLVFD